MFLYNRNINNSVDLVKCFRWQMPPSASEEFLIFKQSPESGKIDLLPIRCTHLLERKSSVSSEDAQHLVYN